MSDRDNSKEQSKSRRRVLKSIAIGGGASATVPLVAKTWIPPVVESVVLPAHATTSVTGSGDLSGLFSGTATVAGVIQENPGELQPAMVAQEEGIERRILDFLIPSANASHARTGWCNGPSPDVSFFVRPDSNTVDVCVMWQGGDDDSGLVYQTTTTRSGSSIADFSVTGGDDEVDSGGGVSFTNCVISGNTITGNHQSNGDGDAPSCSGTFALSRSAGSFSCGGAVMSRRRVSH